MVDTYHACFYELTYCLLPVPFYELYVVRSHSVFILTLSIFLFIFISSFHHYCWSSLCITVSTYSLLRAHHSYASIGTDVSLYLFSIQALNALCLSESLPLYPLPIAVGYALPCWDSFLCIHSLTQSYIPEHRFTLSIRTCLYLCILPSGALVPCTIPFGCLQSWS